MQYSGETVTLINRTKGPLEVCVDGVRKVLKPGPNVVDRVLVPYAKRQNKVMGTEDPGNPLDFQSLVGVKEWGDDVTPCEQSKAAEALDRSLIAGPGAKAKVVRVTRGLSRPLVSGDDLPRDADFAKDRA